MITLLSGSVHISNVLWMASLLGMYLLGMANGARLVKQAFRRSLAAIPKDTHSVDVPVDDLFITQERNVDELLTQCRPSDRPRT